MRESPASGALSALAAVASAGGLYGGHASDGPVTFLSPWRGDWKAARPIFPPAIQAARWRALVRRSKGGSKLAAYQTDENRN